MKYVYVGAVIALFMFAGVASAQMGMMGAYWEDYPSFVADNEEMNMALEDIYASQNISSQAEIDCGLVTESQLERLGDAYMSGMLSSQTQHDVMDTMMGGEGSAQLFQAHVTMGRSYLGCWSDYSAGPVYMPMMDGFDAGNGDNVSAMPPFHFFMGGGHWFGGGWWHWVTMLLLWAFFVLGIITCVTWLTRNK